MKTERTEKDSVDRKVGEGHSRKEKVGRHTIRSYCDVVKGKEKVNSPAEEVIGSWQAREGLKNRLREEESPSPSEWIEDAEAEEEWVVDESVFIGKEGEVGKQGSQRIGEIEVVGESVQVNDADAAQKHGLPVGRSGENQSQNQRAEGGVQESR
ncbi:hypothetical protein L6452_35405 [Arctium lappa]|uniref:Uncharacterized protein n=1 Tax=Arctium lappa TaxID=4217 RepID=A0ACB8Y7V3_ARCLA|nr:hypothetical protein L6452_35405 [Arctium lappa]